MVSYISEMAVLIDFCSSDPWYLLSAFFWRFVRYSLTGGIRRSVWSGSLGSL